MKRPIFVAFATQKGGAGKSTLTTLVYSSTLNQTDLLRFLCTEI